MPDASRVLIIDDDATVVSAARRILRAAGAQVDACGGALEALALIRGGAEYDLILCDLIMPPMHGTAFLDVLRVEAPRLAIRVVFITGSPQAAGHATITQPGVPMLWKPFGPTELTTLLRQYQTLASRMSGAPCSC